MAKNNPSTSSHIRIINTYPGFTTNLLDIQIHVKLGLEPVKKYWARFCLATVNFLLYNLYFNQRNLFASTIISYTVVQGRFRLHISFCWR